MSTINKVKDLVISLESPLPEYNNNPTLTKNVAIRKKLKAIVAEANVLHKSLWTDYRRLQKQDNSPKPTPDPEPQPQPQPIPPTETLFLDNFDGPDGLITNEEEYWGSGSKNAHWEMTAGQLFRKGNRAYSGIDSDIFRLNTKRLDFKDVVISTKLTVVKYYSVSPAVDWDGVHIWFRYQSQYDLYYASICRRDGKVIFKKKTKGGTENGGTYFELSPYTSVPFPLNKEVLVEIKVQNQSDGSLKMEMFADGKSLLSAVDKNAGSKPPFGPGAVGIRGDNCEFYFDDFKVIALSTNPEPTPDPVNPDNPLKGKALYNDTQSQLHTWLEGHKSDPDYQLLKTKIADIPKGIWISSDWNTDVDRVAREAKERNEVPTFIIYNSIKRDLGSYSHGGAKNLEEYKKWLQEFVNKVAQISFIAILEPDCLPHMTSMNAEDQAVRVTMLREACRILKTNTKAVVYLDAGHPNWLSAANSSDLLKKIGVELFDGFALNVSNRVGTARCLEYGKEVSRLTNGEHFVVDTSRNAIEHSEWCDPSGEGVGEKPTSTTADTACDGYLYLKSPGESDGCIAPAGTLVIEKAKELAKNAK